MLRAFFLCLIAALACGCGRPSPSEDQETSATPESASAASALPASAGGGSTTALTPVSGPQRANKFLQLAVTEAGFDPAGHSAPSGLRHYAAGLRGIGRSRGNDFLLEFQRFVFAQNKHGCISRPEHNATWLQRPFGKTATFTSANPTEGQLAFLVPDDSQRIRVLIAPAGPGGLVVPAGDDFTPA